MKLRILKVVLTCMIGIVALAGCHTVKGAGEDIQSGGRAIEKSTE